MSVNVAFIIPVADILFLAIIAFFAFYGFRRGVLKTLSSIFRIYFSFIIAVLFYEKLALVLQAMADMSSASARIVCFATLFGAILSAMWTTEIVLKRRISKVSDPNSGLNKMGGCVLGLLEGILIISIAIMGINFYPIPDGAKPPLEDAISYELIKQVAPGIEYFTLSPFSRLKDISERLESDDELESDELESDSL